MEGRRIVVLGLQRSGRAAAELAVARGAHVIGCDLDPSIAAIPGVEMQWGPHRVDTATKADLVVVSPGVPATIAPLQAAVAAGVPVIGELAFAASLIDHPMVAITGTNGKSTVTHFVGTLLAAAGMRVFVGGNLGVPLSRAVDRELDVCVVEVSSYQLEWPGDVRPRVAAVLNLAPDHLARHGTMEAYAAAKCRLFDRMRGRDVALIPTNDPLLERMMSGRGTPCRAWLGGFPGVKRQGNEVRVVLPERSARFDLSSFCIPGAHNLDNASVALLMAVAMGASTETLQQAIGTLRSLPHRMEIVCDADGVKWVNDSKATNIDACRVGISGIESPAVVLLGGQAKGAGFTTLASHLRRHRAVVTFGASGPAIAGELRAAGIDVVEKECLSEAVEEARNLTRVGDVVLLSPGCASFDEFDDYSHRGACFRDLVVGGAK